MFSNNGIKKSALYTFLIITSLVCFGVLLLCIFSLKNKNSNSSNTYSDGKSAYDLAVEAGFNGTEAEWLKSLSGDNGKNARSAYDIAVDAGFLGTVEEWLESLVGDNGEKGSSGLDAYQEAVLAGYTGTYEEFTSMLNEAIRKNAKGETGDKGDKGVSVTNVSTNYQLGDDGYLYLYLHFEFSNGSSIDKISKMSKQIDEFNNIFPKVVPLGSKDNVFFVDVTYSDGSTTTLIINEENYDRYNEYSTNRGSSTSLDYTIDGISDYQSIYLFDGSTFEPYKFINAYELSEDSKYFFIPLYDGTYKYSSSGHDGIDLDISGYVHYSDGTKEYKKLTEDDLWNDHGKGLGDYIVYRSQYMYRNYYEKIWDEETKTFDTRDYNYNANFYISFPSFRYEMPLSDWTSYGRDNIRSNSYSDYSSFVVFYDPDNIDVFRRYIVLKDTVIDRFKDLVHINTKDGNYSSPRYNFDGARYVVTESDLAIYDNDFKELALDNFEIKTIYSDGTVEYTDLKEEDILQVKYDSYYKKYEVIFQDSLIGVNQNLGNNSYYTEFTKVEKKLNSLIFICMPDSTYSNELGELFVPEKVKSWPNDSTISATYEYYSYFIYDNILTNEKVYSPNIYLYRNSDGTYTFPDFVKNGHLNLYLNHSFDGNEYSYHNCMNIYNLDLNLSKIIELTDLDSLYNSHGAGVYNPHINYLYNGMYYDLGQYFKIIILDETSVYKTIKSGFTSARQGVVLNDGVPHASMYEYIGFEFDYGEPAILEKNYYYLDELLIEHPEYIRNTDEFNVSSNKPIAIYYKFPNMENIEVDVLIPYIVENNTCVQGFYLEGISIFRAKVGDTFDEIINSQVAKSTLYYQVKKDYESSLLYTNSTLKSLIIDPSWVDFSTVENENQVFTTPGRYTFRINIGSTKYYVEAEIEVTDSIDRSDVNFIKSYSLHMDEDSRKNLVRVNGEVFIRFDLYDNGYLLFNMYTFNQNNSAYEFRESSIYKYDIEDNILRVELDYNDAFYNINGDSISIHLIDDFSGFEKINYNKSSNADIYLNSKYLIVSEKGIDTNNQLIMRIENDDDKVFLNIGNLILSDVNYKDLNDDIINEVRATTITND